MSCSAFGIIVPSDRNSTCGLSDFTSSRTDEEAVKASPATLRSAPSTSMATAFKSLRRSKKSRTLLSCT